MNPENLKCTKCEFCKTCKYTSKMDASGSKNPIFLFVGEGPGRDEDELGVPFVGKAGNILRGTLDEIGFPIKDCAFTNAVRCWPGKGNPTPKDKHIKACKSYLEEDIKNLKPKVIIMLGAVALKAVAGRVGISKIRGTAWKKGDTYYLPTFHPSSLFYDETKLIPFVKDLKAVLSLPSAGIKNKITNLTHICKTYEDATDMLLGIKEDPRAICVDYETNTLHPWDSGARIITAAFCVDPKFAFCVPLFKKDAPYSEEIAESLIGLIREIVIYRNKHELGFEFYNGPFDIGFAKRAHNIPYPLHIEFDGYSAHHLLNEEMKKPSLSQLTWMYCRDYAGYDEELKKYISEHEDCNLDLGGSYDNIPLDKLGVYNCGDTISAKALRKELEPLLEKEDLLELYKDMVLPMEQVLADFSINGMAVDKAYLSKLSREYQKRMKNIIERVRGLKDVIRYEKLIVRKKEKTWEEEEKERLLLGKRSRKPKKFTHEFNPGSDKQVGHVLFNIAKLTPVKYTPTKIPSVDSEVREELMNAHPLVPLVDEYTGFKNWHGRYVKRIRNGILIDNLYHPSYDITGTVTGRLSGDMQQLPRGTTNKDIKKIFISRFGKNGTLLNQDIAGAELRMFAIVSGDKVLTDIFNNDQDPHLMCASLLYNKKYDYLFDLYKSASKKIEKGIGLTKAEEKVLKLREDAIKPMVSFGLIYGREAAALAKDMNWPLERADKFRTKYFEIFSGVRREIEEIHDFVRTHGYVIDITGRKRRLSIAMQTGDDVKAMREKALRRAVNFCIQAPTHSLVMKAMGIMAYWFHEEELRSKLIGEVHDSVIVDAYLPELELVTTIMTKSFSVLKNIYAWITIPMVTEIKSGPNLLEMSNLTRI